MQTLDFKHNQLDKSRIVLCFLVQIPTKEAQSQTSSEPQLHISHLTSPTHSTEKADDKVCSKYQPKDNDQKTKTKTLPHPPPTKSSIECLFVRCPLWSSSTGHFCRPNRWRRNRDRRRSHSWSSSRSTGSRTTGDGRPPSTSGTRGRDQAAGKPTPEVRSSWRGSRSGARACRAPLPSRCNFRAIWFATRRCEQPCSRQTSTQPARRGGLWSKYIQNFQRI